MSMAWETYLSTLIDINGLWPGVFALLVLLAVRLRAKLIGMPYGNSPISSVDLLELCIGLLRGRYQLWPVIDILLENLRLLIGQLAQYIINMSVFQELLCIGYGFSVLHHLYEDWGLNACSICPILIRSDSIYSYMYVSDRSSC